MSLEAIRKLQELGFDVNEQAVEKIQNTKNILLDKLQETNQLPPEMLQLYQTQQDSEERFITDLLIDWGSGDYNFDTGEWTATSNQVYAFDAEIFDIERMYTLFLQGVQAIVPDVRITEVKEDLSGVTDDMEEADNPYEPPSDGVRCVSFLCNGHPYDAELKSYGDWFNMGMLEFMNQVLEKEGCEKQLHLVAGMMDQMVVLIYDTEEKAARLRELMGNDFPDMM